MIVSFIQGKNEYPFPKSRQVSMRDDDKYFFRVDNFPNRRQLATIDISWKFVLFWQKLFFGGFSWISWFFHSLFMVFEIVLVFSCFFFKNPYFEKPWKNYEKPENHQKTIFVRRAQTFSHFCSSKSGLSRGKLETWDFSQLIHKADQQALSVVIIVFANVVRSYVRPHYSKQNKFQVKAIFATGETLGLAKWIIDDNCLVSL